MNETAVIDYIVNWITSYVENTNGKIKSLVVGVSGGIDSALVSTLCAMTGLKTVVLTIPIKKSNMTLANKHCHFLTKKFDNVWYAIGVHPHQASEDPLALDKDQIKTYLNHKKCVAVGEAGLDYHYNYASKIDQNYREYPLRVQINSLS